MPRSLAAIFAHPDDETFGCGGTLARYAAAGVRCALFCATDGDGGRSSGVPVESRLHLGRLRREELHAAAAVLGVGAVRTPGHPDGGLADVDADRLVGEVVRFLRAERPEVVLTFGPEGAPNTHRDHRAISRAATAAFHLAGLATAYPEQQADALAPWRPARLYYATWPEPAPGDELQAQGVPATARLDVAAFIPQERAAFEAHRTQHDLRDRFERMAVGDAEWFALAGGEPQPRAMVDDLFEGLR